MSLPPPYRNARAEAASAAASWAPALTVGLLCLTALAGCNGFVTGGGGIGPGGSSGPVGEAPPAVGAEFQCADADARGPAPLRRLTIPEYITTIEAALGVDLGSEGDTIPPDVRADGFSNTASGLVVDVAHVEAFAALAQSAISQVDDLDAVLTASDVTCRTLDERCETETVEALALRLYRGPATANEVASLRTVFAAVAAEEGDYAEGVRFVIEAMLQSPRFLYKVERQDGEGPYRTLSGWETASRLSYLLWGAPPDDALREAAGRDALLGDADIEAQAERMLRDPRARQTSLRYLEDWLHLGRLDHLAREEGLFPGWSPELAADMKAETRAYFERLIWEEDRPLGDLWNAQVTFLNGRLAEYYGVPLQGDAGDEGGGVAEYDLSSIPERGGFLTQGSLLTIGGPSASMVARGKFFLENVLCGSVNAPPPGVDATPPEPMPGYTQRDQSEERRENPTCGGCHAQMDPLAYGLERFDGTGAFALEDEFGNELREDGNVLFPGEREPVPFATIGELMDLLAGSDRVRDCTSLKATQFALGRALADSDGCSLAAVRETFSASDGTYRDLMVAIALSPGFRTIRVE